MATETKAVEILASHRYRGDYDYPCETRLVKRDGKHYLVHPSYCGEGSLEGGACRDHLYAVPESMIPIVLDLVQNAEEYDPEYPDVLNKFQRLVHDVIGDLAPHAMGRRRDTGWQAEL